MGEIAKNINVLLHFYIQRDTFLKSREIRNGP